MTSKYFAVFISIILSTFSTQAEIKPQMQEFYLLTQSMHGYLTDKSAYLDDKNNDEIKKKLNEFVIATEKFKKDKMAQSEDMKFRAEQISESLKESEEAFKNGFKDYSYWVLKSSFNNCYACHTQKSLPETVYKFEKNGEGNFSKAEYLFLVRNYKEAIPLYQDLITGYPKNKVSIEALNKSIEKILFYLVRVQRDDQKSIVMINSLLKNKKLLQADINNLNTWKNYLGLKKYRVVEELMIQDQKRLEEWVAEREQIAKHYSYAGQRVIVDLETTHHLFKLLETTTDKQLRPWLLYWLADIERNYRQSMFDSTSELYLKECIVKFSKSAAAKKCFALLKDIKVESFTGSRGTELPASVEQQLNSYEKLVK